MNRDDIIRLARDAGLTGLIEADVIGNFERFAALVAAEVERQMTKDGWRKCAEGQSTTQYCAVAEAALRYRDQP